MPACSPLRRKLPEEGAVQPTESTRSQRLLQRKRDLAGEVLERLGVGAAPVENCLASGRGHVAGSAVVEDGALERLRQAGRERFLEFGAPVRQDEYWKYTDPAPLLGEGAAASASEPQAESQVGGAAVVRVTVEDGVPGVAGALPDGLEVVPLGDPRVEEWFGASAFETQLAVDSVQRPFAALNAAACDGGLAVRASGEVKGVLHLVDRSPGRSGMAFGRCLVCVEAGAALEMLVDDPADGVGNSVTLARVAEAGRLDHVRLQVGKGRRDSAAMFVRLERGASFAGFTLSADGDLCRNETVLHLDGEGASGTVACGMLGSDAGRQDATVLVVHSAPGCESRQVLRGAFRDRSAGVFQGKILVERPAQKTDGYQISQTLLLDERAEFNAKPELEIYADDVKCSHGSTTGALDPDALFYLRSRGLGRQQAETLLIEAFLEEALQEIRSEGGLAAARAATAAWMRDR